MGQEERMQNYNSISARHVMLRPLATRNAGRADAHRMRAYPPQLPGNLVRITQLACPSCGNRPLLDPNENSLRSNSPLQKTAGAFQRGQLGARAKITWHFAAVSQA